MQGMLNGRQQLSLALEYGDLLRASMAGNLRSFEFENAQGQVQAPLAGAGLDAGWCTVSISGASLDDVQSGGVDDWGLLCCLA